MALEIVLAVVGPAIEVVKWVGAPILRQFQYLCCFTTNIANLKNEAENLQGRQRDLQGKVDEARNDVRLISSEVETWLLNSDQIIDEKDEIIDQVPDVEGGCLKLRDRFSLSKRAKKTADRLKEHRDQCRFDADAISQARPPAARSAVPLERTYEFESRKQIEENIMATLKGEDVNMIGICGMGGLGKTTMAKRIMNKALEEHVFQEVVMAVVSRPIDQLKIQLEIGGTLGLRLEGESSQGRVQKLHARLSGPKRILLVLDDVWENLVLEDLGIPLGNRMCSIILTSRNRDVLSAIKVQKDFGVEVLSEEDSWFLFRERVGTRVDNTKFNFIAKLVVGECKGLPISLTTVGAALKDEVDVRVWENALKQLRRCDPDIPEYSANVFNHIKLSYDVLESKYKSVFLLCSLFPEDVDIPLEHLTYFCMGLDIFGKDNRSLEDDRNRMHGLTTVLKKRSLLLDSEDGDDYVRMHDVIRDACIYIAQKEGYISDAWTSSLQRYKLPSKLGILRISDSADVEFEFDGILRVLYLLSIEKSLLRSLSFTQTIENLTTLVLDSCKGLETLSDVGWLEYLEILICRYCHSIEELPWEITNLNRLKVLDLTRCENLQRIGLGIVSSLVGLEELKMLGSFNKWEAEDSQKRENARLRELEALTKLRCLEIEIEDSALAAENIRLSSDVNRFTITFLCERHVLSKFDEYLSKRKLRLNWVGGTCLGDWIKMQLLRDTECLFLVGNGANNVDLTKLENIRCLDLGRCESMKYVMTTSMDNVGGSTVFPSIDHLMLFKLPKLEEIWDGRVSLSCFQILKELKLDDLPALKQLWKSDQNDLGKVFLPQLEVLEIWRCEMMEQVFLWNGNENNSCHHITKMFPKLKELELRDLPNLISFCEGIEGIEFPLLKRMEIEECKKMKGMVANGKRSSTKKKGVSSSINVADTHHLFCESQVSFGCLKELRTDRNPLCNHTIHVSLFNGLEDLAISEYRGSMSLFTSSIAENLVSLKLLWIGNCDEMVQVIKDDEKKGLNGGERALLFPKLHKLHLWNLRKLVNFCEWKCDVEFPSLMVVDIRKCPNMKNFTLGSLAAQNLESFKTDLNNYLLQVSFNSMKELSVQGNENPLNGYQIHRSVFDRLEVLNINEYEGTMSLFSSSITKNLVNLTRLTIINSRKMVKVIEDKEEKDKMVSGDERTLLFPKLHKLQLKYLNELVSFCKWKCDVELPSLMKVEIYKCDNMKSCTLGSLNTPKLKSVVINNKDVGDVKDLNGLVQQQYLRRAEVRTTNIQNEEEEAKDQEPNGEIVEEQN